MKNMRVPIAAVVIAAAMTGCLCTAAASDLIREPGEVHGTITNAQCELVQKQGSVAGAIGGGAVGAVAGGVLGKALFGKGGDAIGGLLGGLAGGTVGENMAAERIYRCVIRVTYSSDKQHWVETVGRSRYINGEAVRMVRNGEGQWLLTRL